MTSQTTPLLWGIFVNDAICGLIENRCIIYYNVFLLYINACSRYMIKHPIPTCLYCDVIHALKMNKKLNTFLYFVISLKKCLISDYFHILYVAFILMR